MFFVCHPKILRKRCLQFLLGVKMAPRETENNAYAKFWGDKQRTIMVRYGIFWGGQFRTRLLRLLLEMYGTANLNWSSEPREGLSVFGAYTSTRSLYIPRKLPTDPSPKPT